MSDDKNRFSVTFVPAALRALQMAVELTEMPRADVINRAVQVYAFLEKERAEGKELMLRGEGGEMETVRII